MNWIFDERHFWGSHWDMYSEWNWDEHSTMRLVIEEMLALFCWQEKERGEKELEMWNYFLFLKDCRKCFLSFELSEKKFNEKSIRRAVLFWEFNFIVNDIFEDKHRRSSIFNHITVKSLPWQKFHEKHPQKTIPFAINSLPIKSRLQKCIQP